MLTPQLQALRLQLENVSERSKEQNDLLGELLFLDRFSQELVHRIGATVPPGPTSPPSHCKTCGKPLP
jgi:hypothetical protein